MYKIGDFIIYGSNGVCKIEDIGISDIHGSDKNRIYYTLNPVYENSKIFVPVDTSVFMRPIISYEEAQNIIKRIPEMKEMECKEKNSRLLHAHYKDILQTHDCEELLAGMVGIYEKQMNAANKGKKLGQIDDKFMKVAEGLINDEFSIALGIPRDEVELYIKNKVKEIENNK